MDFKATGQGELDFSCLECGPVVNIFERHKKISDSIQIIRIFSIYDRL
jgi:hypothetical protein